MNEYFVFFDLIEKILQAIRLMTGFFIAWLQFDVSVKELL